MTDSLRTLKCKKHACKKGPLCRTGNLSLGGPEDTAFIKTVKVEGDLCHSLESLGIEISRR